jgi:hypothetical protein
MLKSPSSDAVTPSRFERRLPRGRLDLAFRVAFGTTGAAARYLHVSRMTIWRWRHGHYIPDWVAEVLTELVNKKVAEAHDAEQGLRFYCQEPPKPVRPLSGCCAGYMRKPKGYYYGRGH